MKNEKIKGISTVIWDCDYTIWLHQKNELETIISKAVGIPYTEELKRQHLEFFVAFRKRFADDRVTFEGVAKVIQESMPILSEYGVTGEEFLYKWNHSEAGIENKESKGVLKYQKEKGYNIVVLTDWFLDSQIILLKKFGLFQYVDKIYACDNEYMKPHPKSGQRIIIHGKESEYVIIGDSLKSDIALANNAKVRSIWYNPYKNENTTPYIPTAEVTSLLEVIEIIE